MCLRESFFKESFDSTHEIWWQGNPFLKLLFNPCPSWSIRKYIRLFLVECSELVYKEREGALFRENQNANLYYRDWPYRKWSEAEVGHYRRLFVIWFEEWGACFKQDNMAFQSYIIRSQVVNLGILYFQFHHQFPFFIYVVRRWRTFRGTT